MLKQATITAMVLLILAAAALIMGVVTGRAGTIEGGFMIGPSPKGFDPFCKRFSHWCRPNLEGAVRSLYSLERVQEVNAEINTAFTYQEDPVNTDVWRPVFKAPIAGDCEDYAITKAMTLHREGVEIASLIFAQVDLNETTPPPGWTGGPRAHLVLIFRHHTGDYVLDTSGPIYSVESYPHRLTAVQGDRSRHMWWEVILKP